MEVYNMINIANPLYEQIKDISAEDYNRIIDRPVIRIKDPIFYENIRKYESKLFNWLTSSTLYGVVLFWVLFLYFLPSDRIDFTGTVISFFLWIAFAYYIHRKNHNPISENTGKFNRWWTFNIHGFHHLFPHHPKNIVIPVWVSSIVIIPFVAISYLLFPVGMAFGNVLGFIGGHIYIEITHFAMHYETPFFTKFTSLLKLKTHHMNHHYINPHKRFTYFHEIEDKLHGTE